MPRSLLAAARCLAAPAAAAARAARRRCARRSRSAGVPPSAVARRGRARRRRRAAVVAHHARPADEPRLGDEARHRATRRSTSSAPRSPSAPTSLVDRRARQRRARRRPRDPRRRRPEAHLRAPVAGRARSCARAGCARSAATSIVDRGYFAPAAHDPARFDNEPRRAYNVGPDALLVNFQAIDFRFVPDGRRRARRSASPTCPTSRSRAASARARAVRRWRRGLTARVRRERASSPPWSSAAPIPADVRREAPGRSRSSTARASPRRRCAGCGARRAACCAARCARARRPAEARLFYRHESEPLAEPRARHEQVSPTT